MNYKLSAVALSLVLLSGCSSIVSDSKYSVAIASSPSEANFTLKNRKGLTIHSGRTPTSISLNASSGFFKGETYTLVLNKEGYEEKTVEINSSVDGWYFGNILFGGLIGLLIVDPATGAMFKLPERSDTSLDLKIASENKDGSLTIALIDSIPESERSSLIELN
ncbi:hypothetical protein [Psychromonas sp.]|uniref:hypothetical protein n=1 Tax=Psychromonas sp. TaxID=1884585 RepID=UPI0035618B19